MEGLGEICARQSCDCDDSQTIATHGQITERIYSVAQVCFEVVFGCLPRAEYKLNSICDKEVSRKPTWGYTSRMSQQCLFCDNLPGSREHLWPAWIHRRRDFGPLKMQRGTSAEIIVDPEQKVRTVCGTCNNGWMSKLEQENIPLIGSMFQDISIPLDTEQQLSIAIWTLKTAMTFDSTKGRNAANSFYSHAEGVNLRLSQAIPDRTRIWIGRLSESHIGMTGTDFTIQTSSGIRLGVGTSVTLAMGHFVSQIVATHIAPEYADRDIGEVPSKPGDWGKMLIQIWPQESTTVTWPPKVSFTNGGPKGYAYLLDRWRTGEKVSKVTRDGIVPLV